MIDQFIDNSIDQCTEENKFLSYIFDCLEFLPSDFDYDENGEQEFFPNYEVIIDFKKRYNEKKLYSTFKYADYQGDIDIRENIKAFDLDPEKFWYLLLFIHDFCCGACLNPFEIEKSAQESIEELNDLIYDSLEKKRVACFNLDDASLTYKYGKKKVVINNKNALLFIIDAIQKSYSSIQENLPMTCRPISKCENISNTKLIAYFTKWMLKFFETHAAKEVKRASRYMFISELMYFTKISRNLNFAIDPRTLKGYLSKIDLPNLRLFNADYAIAF